MGHGDLEARDEDLWTVVIETPRGKRNKYKFDEKLGVFRLGGTLPAGHVFPFDFGYIPGTLGEDGDPLDVLVLMDEPAFPGCVVQVEMLGVIEAEQTEKEGKTVRNDRLIGVAKNSRSHYELDKQLLADIEHFFVSFNEQKGKKFKVLGQHGKTRAEDLAAAAVQ